MLALGYIVFYTPLAYAISHPIRFHWLVWPALAVACVTFAACHMGFGDRPWFARTMTLLIVAVAVTGAITT
ncbi:hypothetical protein ACFQ6V_13020 [Streptomyces roseifaciens]